MAKGVEDTYISALHYRVEHDDTVEFQSTARINYEDERFSIDLADGRARIRMKWRLSSEGEAKLIVEPFLRAWEIQAELDNQYRISFVFDHADIVYPPDEPGSRTIRVGAGFMVVAGLNAKVSVTKSDYPPPAAHFVASDDVVAMMGVYRRYKAGQFGLGPMGYRCLTHLQDRAKKASSTPEARYAISSKVLSTLGRLTTEKGGATARKAMGATTDHTGAEREWVEAAIRAFIKRAGEVDRDAMAARSQITMADLPKLP